MRILHTSDWHLGRTFHGRSLERAHEIFADHLVELVRSENVDAVLISGDVYDRAIPPTHSVRLLDDTLARLAQHTRIVLTPGNHDSATRVGFGSRIMRERVSIRSHVGQVCPPVIIPDADGHDGAVIYPLPYLDPTESRATLPPLLGDPQGILPRSHEAVMGAAMRLIEGDVDSRRRGSSRLPLIAMAHAFVVGGSAGTRTPSADGAPSPVDSPISTGSADSAGAAAEEPERSESERDIRVGMVDSVSASVFDLRPRLSCPQLPGLDYVALGHLHRPQEVHGPHGGPRLVYSGSPLPFSFAEAERCARGNPTSSVLLTWDDAGQLDLRRIPTPSQQRIVTLSGTLSELTDGRYAAEAESWVRVKLTGPLSAASMRALKDSFHQLLAVERVATSGRPAPQRRSSSRASDPHEVCRDFLSVVADDSQRDSLDALFARAYDEALAQNRSE